MLENAGKEVDEIMASYNMGLITNNERYNQIVDIWTRADANLTEVLMKEISTNKQGFNSVFMMLDSGARVQNNKLNN